MPRLSKQAPIYGGTLMAALLAVFPAWGQPTPTAEVPAVDLVAASAQSPRYLLMSPRGRAVTSEDFRGRLQLVTFGFTSCPDVCPTTLLEMTHILAALGNRAHYVQPIFITVDPERDTAQVLGAYTLAFDERILGLTGSVDLVRRATDSFKVQFQKVQEVGAHPDAYTMDHSAGMYLLGPDGTLLRKFGYGSKVADVVEPIQFWLNSTGK